MVCCYKFSHHNNLLNLIKFSNSFILLDFDLNGILYVLSVCGNQLDSYVCTNAISSKLND